MNKDIDWIIHCVIPDGIFEGFLDSHTHGLDKYGHKELGTTIYIDERIIGNILNDCGLRIAEGHKFVPGFDDTVIKNFPVLFHEFEDSDKLYLIFPDPNGKFPGDEGCQFPYDRQLIYAEIIEEDK